LELVGEVLFFLHADSLEQSPPSESEEFEEQFFDCMTSILEDFVLPSKGHSELFPLCSTALSVFAFLMTLLPSHWVHNLFAE